MAMQFYGYRDRLVDWDLDDPMVLPGSHDCVYWAETFRELSHGWPQLSGRVVITNRVDTLPLTGRDVVVVLLNNELVMLPAYSHDVGLVLLPAGTRLPLQLPVGSPTHWPVFVLAVAQQARLHALRAPSYGRGAVRTVRRRSRPRMTEVPMGTFALRDVPFVPFEARRYDAWFMGSRMYDDKPRSGLRAHVQNPKTRARHDLIRVVHQLEADRPDLSLHLATVRSFHDSASFAAEYSTTLMDTRLALCPRGTVIDTYRLCEAMSFGCVPVVEAVPRRPFYRGAPVLTVGDWTRLPRVLDGALNRPDWLAQMHTAALRWWREKLAPRATAARIAAALGAEGAGQPRSS